MQSPTQHDDAAGHEIELDTIGGAGVRRAPRLTLTAGR